VLIASRPDSVPVGCARLGPTQPHPTTTEYPGRATSDRSDQRLPVPHLQTYQAYVTASPRLSLISFCARCSTFSATMSTGKMGESRPAYSPSLLVYRQPAQIANTQRGFPNNRPNIPRLSSMGHQTRRDSLMRDFASSSALNARKSSHEGRFVQGMRTPLRLSIMMQGR